jgi:hypothetical protein
MESDGCWACDVLLNGIWARPWRPVAVLMRQMLERWGWGDGFWVLRIS